MTITLLLLAISQVLGSPAQPAHGASDSAVVVDAVRKQIILDLRVLSSAVGSKMREPLTVERLELPMGPGVRVYRVTPWALSHWHPYLVVVRDSAIVGLGGFPAPDLLGMANSLPHGGEAAGEIWGVAEILARLADPNGAVELIVPRAASASDSGAISAWRARNEPGWPADAISRLPDGAAHVLLTVLSRARHSQAMPWQPLVYGFQFDNKGRLTAWSRRNGQSFVEPATPD